MSNLEVAAYLALYAAAPLALLVFIGGGPRMLARNLSAVIRDWLRN